jgi:alkylation response protein AidB-like acyl-CoA dehydrogenase
VSDLLDAVELTSYHDGSTGWCVMIGGTTGLTSGALPPAHGEAIYSDPRAITGGFGMPAGTAVAVDGGLRVAGRWAWGSGTSHCTWIGGGVRIVDDRGNPTPLPDGTAAPFVFFDLDDVELLDTWHVSGLKGTGSTDYEVADGFVPEGRWVNLVSREPVIDSPLYRFSFFGALAMGVASVTVGLARRAIDEVIALGDKMPSGSQRRLSERPAVQSQVADADAAVRASRAFMREAVDECWAGALDGQVTDEQTRLLRLAANHAVDRSTHAVDLCYHAAGGTAVYETSPLQRVFRDVHVATQHGMVAPRVMEPLGRMLFGLDTDTRQL